MSWIESGNALRILTIVGTRPEANKDGFRHQDAVSGLGIEAHRQIPLGHVDAGLGSVTCRALGGDSQSPIDGRADSILFCSNTVGRTLESRGKISEPYSRYRQHGHRRAI